MFRIEKLNIETFQGRVLVNDLSFSLKNGDKLAVIGEEGNGKSTLLKAIVDENLLASYCKVSGLIFKQGLKIGYLEQKLSSKWDDFCVMDYFLKENVDKDENYDVFLRFNDIKLIFNKIKLSTNYLENDKKIGTLSGGEKVKLQLAKLMQEQHDLVLLDEPTNDLDIETLELLENYVSSTDAPIIFISHDETFLKNTANMVLHIEQLKKKREPKLNFENMSYEEYVEHRNNLIKKQTQIALKERAEDKQRQDRWQKIYNSVDYQLNTISRQNPSGARLLKKKMKSVKAMETRFERERKEMTELPNPEEAICFKLFENTPLPNNKIIVDFKCDGLRVGQNVLATDVELKIVGAEKIAIVGNNGCGKTTLLKQLVEVMKNTTGIKIGYFSQNYEEKLNYENTPIEELFVDQDTNVRTYLGGLKFTQKEMCEKIKNLSEGQKAKILLLKLILNKNNVLVLDEPTRNLSPLSMPVILDMLNSFKGCIVTVSHDRKFINQLCDKVYCLSSNGLRIVGKMS